MNELITVAEYSRARNCSPSAVYKRLKSGSNQTHQYVVKKNGKTYLRKEILEDEQARQPVEENTKAVEDKASTAPKGEEYIAFLMKQIEEKDRQIERLNILLDQQQRLSLNLQLQLTENAGQSASAEENQEQEVVEPEKKKTLWQRLFG